MTTQTPTFKSTRELIDWCNKAENNILESVDTILDNFDPKDDVFNDLMKDVAEIMDDLKDLEEHIKATTLNKNK